MRIAISMMEANGFLSYFMQAQKEAARNEVLISVEKDRRMTAEEDNRDLKRQVEELRKQLVKVENTPPSFTTDAFLRKLAPIFGDAVGGRKIQAIKSVRELTGCGLKEAKDCVEGNYFGAKPLYG